MFISIPIYEGRKTTGLGDNHFDRVFLDHGYTSRPFGIIYQYFNKVSGKSYIGLTVNPYARWNSAFSQVEKKRTKLNCAFWKYRPEDWEIRILASSSSMAALNELEKLLIKQWDSIDNGYNTSEGGEGATGNVASEETRRKMSEAHKNPSDETRKKMSLSRKGRKFTDEHREALSRSRKGYKMPESHRLNMIKSLSGMKRNPESVRKSAKTRSQVYVITSPDGVSNEIWNLREFCDENCPFGYETARRATKKDGIIRIFRKDTGWRIKLKTS